MAVYFLGSNPLKNELSLKNTNSLCCKKCCALLVHGRLTCKCGETEMFSWLWDEGCTQSNCVISSGNKEVLFHPVYSSGTAVVKGDQPFEKNRHYYFEVKVLTYLYGTDVMIGVGTSKMDVENYKAQFCSMLGFDEDSWGYSYRGFIQHNKLKRNYGDEYGLGSIIGVHLDMCQGTLEYYLNRKPLGIAFRGLKEKELYPIVCSTAAQSSIKLSCSISFKPSLQFDCLRELSHDPDVVDIYTHIPGLSYIFQREYFWLIPEIDKVLDDDSFEDCDEDQQLELEDEVVIPINSVKSESPCHLSLNKWGRYVEKQSTNSGKYRKRKCGCIIVSKKQKVKDEAHRKLLTNIEDIRKNLDVKKYHMSFPPDNMNMNIHVDEDNASAYWEEPINKDVFFDGDNVDVYSDIPERSEGRKCEMCSFRLGSHEDCSNDNLCSFCDMLL